MKIKKMMIKNFRCFGEGPDSNGVSFKIGDNDVVLFIGKNNVGKSTILRAYELFVKSKESVNINDFHMKDSSNAVVIECEVKCETDEDTEKQGVAAWLDGDGVARFKKVWKVPGKKAEKYSWDPQEESWKRGGAGGFDSHLQNSLPTPEWLDGFITSDGFENAVKTVINATVLKSITEDGLEEEYRNALESFQELSQKISEHEYVQALIERLRGDFQNIFPGVDISLDHSDAEPGFEKALKKGTDVVLEDTRDVEVPLGNHGHGVRRQLIFSALQAFPNIGKALRGGRGKNSASNYRLDDESEDTALLVEEPELFLHPQAMRTVTGAMYELGEKPHFQILASTHSPVLIDLSRPHVSMVRVVRNDENNAELHQVGTDLFDDDERKRLRMLLDFNPYISEAFFADYVVLVEGDTEEAAFKKLVNRMVDEDHIPAATKPHVINCLSKTNIVTFSKVLAHFSISHFIVHDADSPTKKDGSKSGIWTQNERIWEQIVVARKKHDCAVSRYVMRDNFEDAHNYDASKHKPYRAWEEVEGWPLDPAEKPAVEALFAILSLRELPEEHTQDWLDAKYGLD